MWSRISSLIYKEFLAIWRDTKSRFVLIVPPVMQLFIFAIAATLDVKDVPIGVLNRDNGKQSYELLQRFQGSPFFNHIVYLPTMEDARSFIDNMKGSMVIVLDAQFSRNLEAKKPVEVLLILDGRRSNTTQILLSYVSNIVEQFNFDFTAQAEIKQQNSRLIARNWFNPNLIYYWYNIPCLSGILPMLIALVVVALSVAREKELGTFEQLLVSPLIPLEILIGKCIPAVIIGVLESSLILLAGSLVYQVPFRGSLLILYISLFVFILAIVGIGLFISSIVQTQQQAVLGTFVFTSPSVMLSGFATPIENMPNWLQPVTYAIPLRYYLIISKGIFLKDIPFHIVWNNIWPMLIIASITLTVSTWFFRRKLQ